MQIMHCVHVRARICVCVHVYVYMCVCMWNIIYVPVSYIGMNQGESLFLFFNYIVLSSVLDYELGL